MSLSDSPLDEKHQIYIQDFLFLAQSPKACRLVLNPDASLHATRWRDNLASSRYSRRMKWDQILFKLKSSPTPVTPQEATHYVVCLATPRAGASLVRFPTLQTPIMATFQFDINESRNRTRTGYRGDRAAETVAQVAPAVTCIRP